ncbi:unnamed protein product [Adineta steineri]|uniref:Arrestin C-terminal-like domain-containing protein n=1 Tax=Adineta steineri TaxID=433720 RepID=A0A814BJ33_9BILA|nr:unnamed protein product [Adineta steineri]CAF3665607.1 unnamed protein product [Adineta steineri]CAF3732358.1 unnamed protein product [Adineta steineri]
MGNTNSGSNAPPSPSRWPTGGQDSTSKQIHIRTDQADGFYFTGEQLTGTVEIPLFYFQQYLNNKNNRKPTELILQQIISNDIIIELVGDATYSAEVDAAADSDGHSKHQVNVCRQRCFVILNQDNDKQSIQNNNQAETSFDQTTTQTLDTQTIPLPTTIKGIFQLQIPDALPPSLYNNRPPSVIYTLELNLSSSRYRFQIPIILSSKGCIPHPTIDIELNNNATNQHNINLQASLIKTFYRPGEQIPVRLSYTNPQQRLIRSITVTLIQFYRIHNDQYRLQLDGKEWTFDISTMLPQREWLGETLLQLPYQPLQASFSNQSVGTTQRIECELDYRIFIELNEKKGDDIHLVLPSINVTYQK